MFKFEDIVLKGEFPYRLLTDIDVNGMNNRAKDWAALDLYDPGLRHPKARAKLEEWYETVKDTPFRLLDELDTCCRMDVSILRMAMSRFRDMFLSVTGIHPYTKTITIASTCLQSFRLMHMHIDSLMIYKESGGRVSSRQCELWLEYMARRDNVKIRSSQSTGGEYNLICGARQDVFFFCRKFSAAKLVAHAVEMMPKSFQTHRIPGVA